MGRAASELDVQTPRYNALPVKNSNYCQIFKSQIEESLLQRLSDKEVGWTFSDQEEVAILDMRMCMERSFMFGNKAKISLEEGTEIMLTGGIWHQTDHDFTYKTIDNPTMTSLMRQAFSGSNGSTRKVLLAGSGLIEHLSNQNYHKVMSVNDRVVKWGVDFDLIVSKFGTLYVVEAKSSTSVAWTTTAWSSTPSTSPNTPTSLLGRPHQLPQARRTQHRSRSPHRSLLSRSPLPHSPYAHHPRGLAYESGHIEITPRCARTLTV